MDLKKFKKTGFIDLSTEDINDPGTMFVVQNLLDKQQNSWELEIEEISRALDISKTFSAAIWYLRTRSRWTEKLENELISMAKNGEDCPNMCDWP